MVQTIAVRPVHPLRYSLSTNEIAFHVQLSRTQPYNDNRFALQASKPARPTKRKGDMDLAQNFILAPIKTHEAVSVLTE